MWIITEENFWICYLLEYSLNNLKCCNIFEKTVYSCILQFFTYNKFLSTFFTRNQQLADREPLVVQIFWYNTKLY